MPRRVTDYLRHAVPGERAIPRQIALTQEGLMWQRRGGAPRAGGWVPTAWSGEFSDYRELVGMRMPTAAEVGWDLPEGRFVSWRGRIDSAVAVDSPFAAGV